VFRVIESSNPTTSPATTRSEDIDRHDVKHPSWRCPKCHQTLFWFGAASHRRRCMGTTTPR